VVTTFDLDEYVYGALRGGAAGFVLKDAGPALLVEAVRAAHNGDALVSPSITVRLLRHLTTPKPEPDKSLPSLSEREIEMGPGDRTWPDQPGDRGRTFSSP
jgi:DNA-binding NarL/FixJ family response regulator